MIFALLFGSGTTPGLYKMQIYSRPQVSIPKSQKGRQSSPKSKNSTGPLRQEIRLGSSSTETQYPSTITFCSRQFRGEIRLDENFHTFEHGGR